MSISPETNDSDAKSNSVKIVVDNTYICQYCAQKFKSYFQLKSHMVEHKSEQVSLSCSRVTREIHVLFLYVSLLEIHK